MKLIALLAGASMLSSASALCASTTCASSDERVGDAAMSCDDLTVLLGMGCDGLEIQFGCECASCLCENPNPGGITDPPDASTTIAGGGPGGGGGDGEDPDPDATVPVPGDGDGDHATPPPVETPPRVTVPDGVTIPTPPPIGTGGGNGGATHGPEVDTVPPTEFPDDRTTQERTTPTTYVFDGTHTLPPVEITTTTYLSTSHWGEEGQYLCIGTCAKDEHQGDGFCDDYNNKCNCDWDGGDCCGTENHYIYCTACKCKDPAFRGVFNCPGECGSPDLYGDGYCDDDNNICACSWDGGDCCGDENHYGFCTECQCLDVTYVGHDPTCNGNCGAANYVGDGFCDDDNNNCGCDWDSGDCCGNTNSYAHCDDCFCRDPDSQFVLDPESQHEVCGTPCFSQGLAGDGFCDDANNGCGCAWDGGDCCGGQNVYTYCDDCLCVDPLYSSGYPPNCANAGVCGTPDHQGDAYCDDYNNNCGCSWDGGDCCGAEHFYSHCTDCVCLDPAYNGEVLCSGACKTKAYRGDGYCDDGNNVCGCDWDGGDCCDHNAKTTHCTDCLCLDPNYEETTCVTPCDRPNFVGDGYCDDGNNICGCDWDNGDCCGTDAGASQYFYCNDCRCQDPDSADFTHVSEECTGQCGHSSWVGDTHCDDNNNNCGCGWDGGDCCGSANSYTYCTQCACLDPTMTMTCQGACQHSGLVGDLYCDDGNNNCGCDWDGGDCCGDDVILTSCTDCQCLDPALRSFSTEEPSDTNGGTQGHTTEVITAPPTVTLPNIATDPNHATAPGDAHGR